MSDRTGDFLVAIVVSPPAASLSIALAQILIVVITGQNLGGAIDIIWATSAASLFFLYPVTIFLGAPCFRALERNGVDASWQFSATGALVGAVVSYLLFRGVEFVIFGTLAGTVIAAIFRALIDPRLANGDKSRTDSTQ